MIDRLAAPGVGPVLLMNGFDHLPPDTTTAEVAAKVGAQRALLDEAAAALARSFDSPRVRRCAHRRAHHEPASRRVVVAHRAEAAQPRGRDVAHRVGRTVERARVASSASPTRPAAIDSAWGTLLENQAHDSIGGCSVDPVHERMEARYDDAEGLGRATVTRVLERLAGRDLVRNTPWREAQELVVFNATADDRAPMWCGCRSTGLRRGA